MSSTTYDHFFGYSETVTKYHHFVDVNKIVRPNHFAAIGNMVRNAGQLPLPFGRRRFFLCAGADVASCCFPHHGQNRALSGMFTWHLIHFITLLLSAPYIAQSAVL